MANEILVQLGKLFSECLMSWVNGEIQEELQFRGSSPKIKGAVSIIINQIKQPKKSFEVR